MSTNKPVLSPIQFAHRPLEKPEEYGWWARYRDWAAGRHDGRVLSAAQRSAEGDDDDIPYTPFINSLQAVGRERIAGELRTFERIVDVSITEICGLQAEMLRLTEEIDFADQKLREAKKDSPQEGRQTHGEVFENSEIVAKRRYQEHQGRIAEAQGSLDGKRTQLRDNEHRIRVLNAAANNAARTTYLRCESVCEHIQRRVGQYSRGLQARARNSVLLRKLSRGKPLLLPPDIDVILEPLRTTTKNPVFDERFGPGNPYLRYVSNDRHDDDIADPEGDVQAQSALAATAALLAASSAVTETSTADHKTDPVYPTAETELPQAGHVAHTAVLDSIEPAQGTPADTDEHNHKNAAGVDHAGTGQTSTDATRTSGPGSEVTASVTGAPETHRDNQNQTSTSYLPAESAPMQQATSQPEEQEQTAVEPLIDSDPNSAAPTRTAATSTIDQGPGTSAVVPTGEDASAAGQPTDQPSPPLAPVRPRKPDTAALASTVSPTEPMPTPAATQEASSIQAPATLGQHPQPSSDNAGVDLAAEPGAATHQLSSHKAPTEDISPQESPTATPVNGVLAQPEDPVADTASTVIKDSPETVMMPVVTPALPVSRDEQSTPPPSFRPTPATGPSRSTFSLRTSGPTTGQAPVVPTATPVDPNTNVEDSTAVTPNSPNNRSGVAEARGARNTAHESDES